MRYCSVYVDRTWLIPCTEYQNKTITKLVGSPYVGCYLLAVIIFSLSAFRDSL